MLNDQEKKDLRQTINGNKHEIYVVSVEEMDAIVRSSPKGNSPSVKQAWEKLRAKLNLGASYYASADDIVTLTKLIGDLGSVSARAYIKNYGGKQHIILKGQPGLRKVLTGTKYGIKNPKVITMGLGKAGAASAAKQGGIISVVLLTAYRIADYVLTDDATLRQLVGTLATDVVKIGIATGAAIVAASAVAGVTTIAVGPILAVIVVGVGTSMLLEYADQSLGITDKVIAGLDELSERAEDYAAQTKQQAERSIAQALDSAIDYMIDSAKTTTIRWIEGRVREYLSPIPRVR